MTVATTDTRNARPAHHMGGRRRQAIPWLLVPLIAVLGGCALVLQVMPVADETLRGLAAMPDLWGARLSAALPGVAPLWITRTLDGLATGMMIFLMASGLTLMIGLMGVINFGHGAFVTLGAFVAVSALARLGGETGSTALEPALAAIGVAMLVAMAVAGAAGALFERVILRPAGGSQMKQILVSVGGLIIAEHVIAVFWGRAEIAVDRPAALTGTVILHGIELQTHGLLVVGIGLTVVALMALVARRTRTGLVLRAAMQDREMVEVLGYRLRAVSVGVFIAGAALAALGGVLWALRLDTVTAQMGADITVMVFVSVMIGGLGSVTGCFLAALMIGLAQSYMGSFGSGLTLVSAMAVLGLVLLWRPSGMLARQSGRAS